MHFHGHTMEKGVKSSHASVHEKEEPQHAFPHPRGQAVLQSTHLEKKRGTTFAHIKQDCANNTFCAGDINCTK